MTIGSNVNPNFPIPGIDQSSRGFRDNFSTIKTELENLQGKTIQLTGDITSGAIQVGNGTNAVVIPTIAMSSNVAAQGSNWAVQYNNGGVFGGSNVFWDSSNVRLGINKSLPSTTLDVAGGINSVGNINISPVNNGSSSSLTVGNANAQSTWGLGTFNSVNGAVSFGSINNTNVNILSNSNSSIFISNNGQVAINGIPTRQLDVYSQNSDISAFHSNTSTSDNGVRAITTGNTSTIGWILDNSLANSVGGIRLDMGGNISLHSGASTGSSLNTSTARLWISNSGRVGIGAPSNVYLLSVAGTFSSSGIQDNSANGTALWISSNQTVGVGKSTPAWALDVVGNTATSGSFISNDYSAPFDMSLTVSNVNAIHQRVGSKDVVVTTTNTVVLTSAAEVYSDPGMLVNNVATIVDSWPVTSYRTARYLGQVENGSNAQSTELLVIHNGIASNIVVIGNITTGVNLGSYSANVVNGNAQLWFTGTSNNNIVKTSRLYVTSTAASIPGVPTFPGASGLSSSSIAVSWSAPITGGTPTAYTVQYSNTSSGPWTTLSNNVASTSYTATGLSPSTTYWFEIAASNVAGTSAYTSPVSGTTLSGLAIPGVPTAANANATSTSNITVSWSPPISGGAVANYTVQYSNASIGPYTTLSNSIVGTSYPVTGLASGTTYWFEIAANNASGSSAFTSPVSATTQSIVVGSSLDMSDPNSTGSTLSLGLY